MDRGLNLFRFALDADSCGTANIHAQKSSVRLSRHGLCANTQTQENYDQLRPSYLLSVFLLLYSNHDQVAMPPGTLIESWRRAWPTATRPFSHPPSSLGWAPFLPMQIPIVQRPTPVKMFSMARQEIWWWARRIGASVNLFKRSSRLDRIRGRVIVRRTTMLSQHPPYLLYASSILPLVHQGRCDHHEQANLCKWPIHRPYSSKADHTTAYGKECDKPPLRNRRLFRGHRWQPLRIAFKSDVNGGVDSPVIERLWRSRRLGGWPYSSSRWD